MIYFTMTVYAYVLLNVVYYNFTQTIRLIQIKNNTWKKYLFFHIIFFFLWNSVCSSQGFI